VATIAVNRPDLIEFKNIATGVAPADAPTVTAQAGFWQIDSHKEKGIVIDVFGDEPPLLTSSDARKLAKWLNKAADDLDGTKGEKSNKKRRQWEDEDEYEY